MKNLLTQVQNAMLATLMSVSNGIESLMRPSTDKAQINIVGAVLGTLGVILTVIVTFLVVANLFGDFAGAVADVNENLTNDSVTFGDETTDAIKPIFAIVVGLTALIGLVGLILAGFDRNNF